MTSILIFVMFIQTPLCYHDSGNRWVVISPWNLALKTSLLSTIAFHFCILIFGVSIMSYWISRNMCIFSYGSICSIVPFKKYSTLLSFSLLCRFFLMFFGFWNNFKCLYEAEKKYFVPALASCLFIVVS